MSGCIMTVTLKYILTMISIDKRQCRTPLIDKIIAIAFLVERNISVVIKFECKLSKKKLQFYILKIVCVTY